MGISPTARRLVNTSRNITNFSLDFLSTSSTRSNVSKQRMVFLVLHWLSISTLNFEHSKVIQLPMKIIHNFNFLYPISKIINTTALISWTKCWSIQALFCTGLVWFWEKWLLGQGYFLYPISLRLSLTISTLRCFMCLSTLQLCHNSQKRYTIRWQLSLWEAKVNYNTLWKFSISILLIFPLRMFHKTFQNRLMVSHGSARLVFPANLLRQTSAICFLCCCWFSKTWFSGYCTDCLPRSLSSGHCTTSPPC